jgi:hypothetical protein
LARQNGRRARSWNESLCARLSKKCKWTALASTRFPDAGIKPASACIRFSRLTLNHFEALLYTFVSKRSCSTKLLRITVGRGLAIQDSPAVRLALAELPQQE